MENGQQDTHPKLDDVTPSTNVANKLPDVHGPYLYREDVVISKAGMIGIVTEVAGDSDSDSDTTTSDDDDDDDQLDDEDNEDQKDPADNNTIHANDNTNNTAQQDYYKCGPLQPDQVRVQWMDDTQPVQNINDLKVVDRGFLHGDFVASAFDPTAQLGVVQDVHISVDLLAPDGSIIKHVSSKDLKRVRDFMVGDHVVLGPWIGRIDDVLDNVTVLIDDGSVCKVFRAEPINLEPISKNNLEADGNFPYYPGQRVKAKSSTVFKNSRWLSGWWRANRLEGTVTKVTTGSVFIYWIASAGYGPDSSTPPAEEQSPKNLKLLSCFSHANWQVGDRCLLPSSAHLSSTKLYKGLSELKISGSVNTESESYPMDSEEVTHPEESIENSDYAPEEGKGIVINKSSPESSSCASSLSVSKEPAHEPWPLHRKKIRRVTMKREKKARKKEENFEKAVLIVNTKTEVDVVWQGGNTEYRLEATSLIPVDNPGDHEFVAEQYVVEKASDEDGEDSSEPKRVGVVKNVNAKDRTVCVKWLKPVERAEDPREYDKEEIVSVYELEGHPDYDYCYGDVVVRLSPVSASVQTTGSGDAMEEPKQQAKPGVKKGSKSKKEDGRSGDEAYTEFSDLSWVGNITGLKNGDIEVTWADGMVSMVGPQAIYVVGRDDDEESIAAGSEVSGDAASWETVNDDDDIDVDVDVDVRNAQEVYGIQSTTDMNYEAEESSESNSGRNPALSLPLAAIGFVTWLASGIFSRGRRIEDSDSRSDNETLSQGLLDILDNRNEFISEKHNNVIIDDCSDGREEHSMTQVPDSLDLTDALSNLKAEQPEVDQDTSSFRRFDIVRDPLDHYFLGVPGQSNNTKKWLKKVQQDWNILQNNLPDGICVRVYEDRMDLLRAVIVGAYGTPYQDGLFFFDFHLPYEYPDVPPDFEEIIKDHFKQRGYYILKACDAYKKGCLIGSLSKDASNDGIADSTSVGFKLMLAKIVPKLFLSLKEVGADCEEFRHLQEQQ
ncbi:hypothetical protein ACFE04_014413 [Oxalis oulophora]